MISLENNPILLKHSHHKRNNLIDIITLDRRYEKILFSILGPYVELVWTRSGHVIGPDISKNRYHDFPNPLPFRLRDTEKSV